jgi:hypothetical protein
MVLNFEQEEEREGKWKIIYNDVRQKEEKLF